MSFITKSKGFGDIEELFSNGLSGRMTDLYDLVFAMATQRYPFNFSEDLYNDYRRRMEVCLAKLRDDLSQLLGPGAAVSAQRGDRLPWLRDCLRVLRSQARFVHRFTYGFAYLERYYVKGDANHDRPPKQSLVSITAQQFSEQDLHDCATTMQHQLMAAFCSKGADGHSPLCRWQLVRDIAKEWHRLFVSLLGPDNRHIDVRQMLRQHRAMSLIGLQTSFARRLPGWSVFRSQDLVMLIYSFIDNDEELELVYGLSELRLSRLPKADRDAQLRELRAFLQSMV